MRETWVIAKREFLERVKSKWFVVMTVLWPVLMVGMMIVPGAARRAGHRGREGSDRRQDRRSSASSSRCNVERSCMKWDATVVPPDTDEKVLRRRIRTHEINGYVIDSRGRARRRRDRLQRRQREQPDRARSLFTQASRRPS